MNMACWNYTLCSYQRTYPQTPEVAGSASLFYAGLGAAGNRSLHSKIFQVPADFLVYPDTNNTKLAQMVNYVFTNGSDYYKICAEEFGPSQQQQTAIATETHKRGYPVMTHASAMLAYEQAIPTMTDGLQHVADDATLTDEMIDAIRANDQFVTPTTNLTRLLLPIRRLWNSFAAIFQLMRLTKPCLRTCGVFIRLASQYIQGRIPRDHT